MKLSPLAAAVLTFSAFAQPGNVVGFPPSSSVAAAQELSAHLSGKAYYAIYADGTRVQSKFGADGSLFASAPGYTDTGKWRVEEGKLCGSLRKIGEFCNDARFDAGTLYLRRMNGQIVRYMPD